MSDDPCFKTLQERLRYLSQVAKTSVMRDGHARAADRIDELERELAAAVKRADAAETNLKTVLDFLRFVPLESGICCCGDSMKDHGNAMNCGHSPVDSGAYYIGKLLEQFEAMRNG